MYLQLQVNIKNVTKVGADHVIVHKWDKICALGKEAFSSFWNPLLFTQCETLIGLLYLQSSVNVSLC